VLNGKYLSLFLLSSIDVTVTEQYVKLEICSVSYIFETVMEVLIKIQVCWDITLCELVKS
jgi:hypothetical protein